jgi:hypothetical protein
MHHEGASNGSTKIPRTYLYAQNNLRMGATIRLGEIEQQVEAHGAVPPLQTDSFEAGQVIDSESMADFLPVGCNPPELARCAVGVAVHEPGSQGHERFSASARVVPGSQTFFSLPRSCATEGVSPL